ncbi:shikimate kinase [Aureivirga marina]|uniref:shikimate kinase n=1 Tax=Aureivirga marina TaxID=1182451 RepID=UPI0018C9EB97|nr:shikimate kinase [Aureivirga marina]
MKISLIGYMGSGKSTIGKLLAEKLKVNYLDLDSFIEEKEKMSIDEIFAQKGEIYFRRVEMQYVKEILDLEGNYVLSMGGGTPCYGNNLLELNSKSKTIYLRASIGTLVQRLQKERENRPIIQTIKEDDLAEFVAKHLFERRDFYEKCQEIISVDNKSIEEIVNEIA